ncbi:uncharacterized protein EDB93DRAFT_1160225 [Suillus bovinus]|uniref:uncharacterized protein n=1 Tax=Suillus bovinus TaxID=48563 RepID=UPI001B86EF5B|nr:uncharacterized protein EDB93DRAFT_1160225 [Suillus bovinus]KAG2141149.1 hypothetical protein EDB93DRAFT_1160225 [Suillus bovinus]
MMVVDKSGRRKISLISNIGMLKAFSMWTVAIALFSQSGNVVDAKAITPLIFIYYLFYDFPYTSMLVMYTLEILPYIICAKWFAIMIGLFRSVFECCLTSRTEYGSLFDHRF